MEQVHIKDTRNDRLLKNKPKPERRELRDTLLDPFASIRPTASHNGVV